MKSTPNNTAALKLLVLSAIFLIAACSQGGGSSRSQISSTPPPPPPPTNSGPVWTQGQFQSASIFKNRCEVVRTGTDIEGNRFPDLPGSALEEKFWLRSWTNETYLWNTEVVDQDPTGFADRLSYFEVLKTTATTPSGEDKDDFHFSQSTEEFLAARTSTPAPRYGVSLDIVSDTPPRNYRVRYTEPGSPAATVVNGKPNFIRGTRILEIDGIDFVNTRDQAEIDTMFEAFFDAPANEPHTFLVEDADGDRRAVTMSRENLAPKPVNRTRIINTPTGRVGYMLINTFSPFESERDIANAFSTIAAQGVSDLVLDLRYNGGGLLATASQTAFMIAGSSRTSGRDFERLRFNANAGNRNPVTGEINEATPFFEEGLGFTLARGTDLTSLNLPRVFILTTERTCSASEAIINGLRGIFVDVIVIGDTTCGKPFGFFPQDNCGETYFTIQFQGVNDLGFGDYTDGFIPENSSAQFGVRAPGCAIEDDFNNELGDESEALLSAALFYQDTGACPSPPPSATAKASLSLKRANTVAANPRGARQLSVMETNRDMTMPE